MTLGLAMRNTIATWKRSNLIKMLLGSSNPILLIVLYIWLWNKTYMLRSRGLIKWYMMIKDKELILEFKPLLKKDLEVYDTIRSCIN